MVFNYCIVNWGEIEDQGETVFNYASWLGTMPVKYLVDRTNS